MNDVADAYGLLDESRTLLRVLNDLSRGGEVKATFQDIQNKCGLDGLRMCWSFKDLHEFGIITLQSGWRPETPVFFKIGKTTDLKARMTQLKIQLPQKPDVVHTIQTNDIHWLEKHWHQHFAGKRANGEWFGLKPDDVAEFTAVEQMTVKVSKGVTSTNRNSGSKETRNQPGFEF